MPSIVLWNGDAIIYIMTIRQHYGEFSGDLLLQTSLLRHHPRLLLGVAVIKPLIELTESRSKSEALVRQEKEARPSTLFI